MQIDTPTESSPNARDSDLTPGNSSKSENKALTYPPQPPRDPIDLTPARGMSLPGSSRKSLSMKKHKCHYCDTEFTRQHNLKSHLLTHSQEKPFTCDQCNAKFRRLHDLKRHAKLHTGERPHICHKCGRRFARGDALARHSKGPGGCAGRRSSIGDDDDPDGGSNPDDSMNIDDPQSKDEEALDYARRRSEPNNRNLDASLHPHAESGTGAFRQHSSTFPGVAAMSGGSRTASISDGRNSSTSHLSPRLGTGGAYPHGQQALPSSSSFAHGGMTESPKPLSPSRADSRQLGGISSLTSARDRSPSYSQSFSSQAHGLGPSGTNSPMNLPLPTSHGPQLPSLSGLANDTRPPSITRPPPLINTHPPPPTGPSSTSPAHQGSNSSSHHQSSAGSIREILNSGPTDPSLLEHTRKVEAENRDLREELKGKMSDKDAAIQRLQDEIRSLRAQQQQHQQDPSSQAPSSSEPAASSR